MTELDRKINLMIMEELGLEEGDKKRVIDQDTGAICAYKGKEILFPGIEPMNKQTIEFDPINNSRMMNCLFGQFIEKLEDEGSINPVSAFYVAQDKDKNVAVITMHESEEISTIESDPYRNDTVALADLMLRLNGEQDVDLSEYDIDRRKKPASVKSKKVTKKKTVKRSKE